MQKTDYIVVGLGLSGLAVTERLLQQGQSVIVIDKTLQSASKVAGGMYNPVILKRFTLAWNADTQLEESLHFYKHLEQKLAISFIKPTPVYRRFHSIEEQNNWFAASDKPILENFIDIDIQKNINPHISGEFGFGKVNHTGTINTKTLLTSYTTYLKSEQRIIEDDVDFNKLTITANGITYKDIAAKGIVFCEGHAISENPYFNFLDVRGNKGEYLIIESKDLQLEAAVKSGIFIIPLGNNLYKVGASYGREDLTPEPTAEKRAELRSQLEDLLKCDYTVIDQVAGIRPTTKDRRPYIGAHHTHKNLFVCNGLGSRGVMTSPVVAMQLVDYMLHQKELPKDIDALRHYKKQ